jgi:alpha-glucosidase (family GH31 glycosyl hydrolase)
MAELSRGRLSVKVQFCPFALTVYRDGVPFLGRISGEADFTHEKNFYSFEPTLLRKSEDSVLLKHRNGELFLELKLAENLLEVSWTTKELSYTVFDYWVTVGEDDWYGQGELRFQVFPLTEHVSLKTPFLANNIQTPFWVTRSGVGVLVDNYRLFESHFHRGLTIRGLQVGRFEYKVIVGSSIREARRVFLARVGLPGRVPNRRMLEEPVYSTWVHYKKDIDEEKVLEYARSIKEYNLPCSIVEIDDKWEEKHGDFTFDSKRFPDPKRIIDEIHGAGYLATLWVYPFVNLESDNYRYAEARGYLALDPVKDEPARLRWWNGEALIGDGEAGLIDISNPEARSWFNGILESLKKEHGLDGFKFDAGDGRFFSLVRDGERILLGRTYGELTPNQYTDEWLRFIAENHYDLAEARVGYLAQRYGVVAREGDKESTWGLDEGLRASITQALTLSITGYPYIMPDMIGGNEYKCKCDKELFVRWVEASALMPVIQFSIPPWRFDDETVEIARKYSLLHKALADYYVKLAEDVTITGEPLLSPLVLRYPEDDASARVGDEYFAGNLLVAPVVEKGAEEREVYLPPGVWRDAWTGLKTEGPVKVHVEAPLGKLPLYAEAHDEKLLALLKKAAKTLQLKV